MLYVRVAVHSRAKHLAYNADFDVLILCFVCIFLSVFAHCSLIGFFIFLYNYREGALIFSVIVVSELGFLRYSSQF